MGEAVRSYKYRLYPSRKQQAKMFSQLDLCCELYNTLLQQCRRAYEQESISLTGRKKLYELTKEIKNNNPRFTVVYSQVLQNCADRLSKAYKNFFRRVKEKAVGRRVKVGFPRFKKCFRSLTYPQFGFSFVSEKCLHLSKIGDIPIILHRAPKGRFKTLTVKRNPAGQWFAIITCIIGAQEPKHNQPDKAVGIDVGLENFATLSDGTTIENPRFLIQSEKKLKKFQRWLSRKIKGSNNWKKWRFRVARVYNTVANQRSDFLHKQSRILVGSYGFIAVEKLNVKSMLRNHRLAKSISDASWVIFVQMLCYKAESAGAEFVTVNPRNTSQKCSQCGRKVLKALSVRWHSCPYCGLSIHRDHNAALNILNTAGQAGIHACGDLASTSKQLLASRVVEAGTIRVEIDARSPSL